MLPTIGWIVWGLVLAAGLVTSISTSPDGGVRTLSRWQRLVVLGGALFVAALPINGMFSLATIPLWIAVPSWLMARRMDRAHHHFVRSLEESRRTGRPLSELLGLPPEDDGDDADPLHADDLRA